MIRLFPGQDSQHGHNKDHTCLLGHSLSQCAQLSTTHTNSLRHLCFCTAAPLFCFHFFLFCCCCFERVITGFCVKSRRDHTYCLILPNVFIHLKCLISDKQLSIIMSGSNRKRKGRKRRREPFPDIQWKGKKSCQNKWEISSEVCL